MSDPENVKLNWENLGDELSRSTASREKAETVMPRVLYLLERIQDLESCDEMTQEWLNMTNTYRTVHNRYTYPDSSRDTPEPHLRVTPDAELKEQLYTSMDILDKALELRLRFTPPTD